MSLLAGKLVLVVDDEPLLREIVRTLIEDEGGSVIEAFDGDSAFALLQAQKVDLVISDVRMPILSGAELARKIRATDPKVPVIILITGFSDLDIETAKKIGVRTILSKPFNSDEFMKEVIASLV
jgi:CheY-like chemotaxis protein